MSFVWKIKLYHQGVVKKLFAVFFKSKKFIQRIDYKFYYGIAHYIRFIYHFSDNKEYFSKGGRFGTNSPLRFTHVNSIYSGNLSNRLLQYHTASYKSLVHSIIILIRTTVCFERSIFILDRLKGALSFDLGHFGFLLWKDYAFFADSHTILSFSIKAPFPTFSWA